MLGSLPLHFFFLPFFVHLQTTFFFFFFFLGLLVYKSHLSQLFSKKKNFIKTNQHRKKKKHPQKKRTCQEKENKKEKKKENFTSQTKKTTKKSANKFARLGKKVTIMGYISLYTGLFDSFFFVFFKEAEDWCRIYIEFCMDGFLLWKNWVYFPVVFLIYIVLGDFTFFFVLGLVFWFCVWLCLVFFFLCCSQPPLSSLLPPFPLPPPLPKNIYKLPMISLPLAGGKGGEGIKEGMEEGMRRQMTKKVILILSPCVACVGVALVGIFGMFSVPVMLGACLASTMMGTFYFLEKGLLFLFTTLTTQHHQNSCQLKKNRLFSANDPPTHLKKKKKKNPPLPSPFSPLHHNTKKT